MRYRVLLLALLLAACSEPKTEEVKLSDALPNIPVPPNGALISREAGVDAIKVRFATPMEPGQVADYYREMLSKAPYTLVSDTRTGANGVALYAEQPGKPSLWVTISSNGASGSFVDVAGAKERPGRSAN